jgi:hypothetical protein
MKTRKFKFKQLLKLQLLKSRVYEHPIKKTNFNDLINANLDQILVGIKKALQIIFEYNQANKRILFIGLPAKLEFKINFLTRHIAVPNNAPVQGYISNNNFKSLDDSTHALFNKYPPKFLAPELIKKPDLLILFNHEKENAILSEAWIAKLPVIAFDVDNNIKDKFNQTFYVVNGNFKNILTTPDKNIFFIGLNFLFKNFKKKKIDSSSNFSKLNQTFSGKEREKD